MVMSVIHPRPANDFVLNSVIRQSGSHHAGHRALAWSGEALARRFQSIPAIAPEAGQTLAGTPRPTTRNPV